MTLRTFDRLVEELKVRYENPDKLFLSAYKFYDHFRILPDEWLMSADPVRQTWVETYRPVAQYNLNGPYNRPRWSLSLCHLTGCLDWDVHPICKHSGTIEEWITEVLALKECGFWFTYEAKTRPKGKLESLDQISLEDTLLVADRYKDSLSKIKTGSRTIWRTTFKRYQDLRDDEKYDTRPLCWSEIDDLDVRDMVTGETFGSMAFSNEGGNGYTTVITDSTMYQEFWRCRDEVQAEEIWVTCTRHNIKGVEMVCKFPIPVVDPLKEDYPSNPGVFLPTAKFQTFTRKFYNWLQKHEPTRNWGTLHFMCNCEMCSTAQDLYESALIQGLSGRCLLMLNQKESLLRRLKMPRSL